MAEAPAAEETRMAAAVAGTEGAVEDAEGTDDVSARWIGRRDGNRYGEATWIMLNEETTTVTTRRDAVSFAVYLDDGRLLLQVRGFFSPDGEPVSHAGMLSINGGGMESDDSVAELLREIHEELGIEFDRSDIGRRIRYLGDV